MDITNLKNNHHLLADYLCSNNYCKDTLWIIRRCIKTALKNGSLPQITSYEDLFLFESKRFGYKPQEGRYQKMKCAMGVLKAFDLEGKYPDGTCNGFMSQPKLIDSLNPYYLFLANRHQKTGQTKGKRAKTVWTEYRVAINFFSHLMNQGANTLAEVEPMMIYSFFFDGIKRIRGRDYCNLVRAVLKRVEGEASSAAKTVLSFLPSIKNGRKNYQFITPNEAKKIRECLEDEHNALSQGERAIGWTLYFYGLRGTDIASMQFGNIDWEHDCISLLQSKTGYPLSLPLNAAVGNAIFDYATKSRPQSKVKTVFVTSRRPHGKYQQLWRIVDKIFRIAEIRTDGGAKGVRIFRHYFVTHLLGWGIECDVVSSLVGHHSPESIKPYADADYEHLRECAIDISMYSVTPNIFEV
tara:strand:- start:2140 stop:3369 length:1230 start_codon:yes stop_codon:yes gene_type:complete